MAVEVISTIKPKNNRTFPVVEACDVKIDETTRLDTKLSKYDDRIAFIEEHLLGIEPEEPDNPDNPDTPAIPKLSRPHIAIYRDEDIIVTIPKLATPVISFYTDVIEIQQLDTPVITLVEPDITKLGTPVIELYNEATDQPDEPTIIKLAPPVIEIYEDSIVEPDEPETPTIIQLAAPTIYTDICNTYSIQTNKMYLLPAVPNGRDTRSIVLWAKVESIDENGVKHYDERTHTYGTTDISNKDYVLKVSGMETDYEGDCFFTLTIDGLFSRHIYADLPKHSTCKIVEAKVVDVGGCEEFMYSLDTPVIELYTEAP